MLNETMLRSRHMFRFVQLAPGGRPMYRIVRIWLLGNLLVGTAQSLAACTGMPRRDQVPASAAGAAPGDYVEEIISNGQARRYRLHIPAAYQPGTPMPLVINLHGLNSNAAQL